MTIINELQLSKDLIKFPSITPRDAGAIKFLSKKLKKLGFNCKILEFKGKGSKPIKNLYARIGKKRPNLCYAGHTDVVPPGNIKDKTDAIVEKENKKLSKYIGKSSNLLKTDLGDPSEDFKNEKGNFVLVYNTKKYGIPCERRFEINSNSIVIGFVSNGCF